MTDQELMLLSEIRELAESGFAREVRISARLSRSEIAAVCGVDQSTVARWETGDRSPRGASGLKYARLIHKLRQADRRVAS